MPGIDDMLERLVADRAFAHQLETDPAQALSGYALDRDDLELLAATLSAEAGASGSVEQRTSKTTLAGLLDAFGGLAAEGPSADRGASNPDSGSSSKPDIGALGAGGGQTAAGGTEGISVSAGHESVRAEDVLVHRWQPSGAQPEPIDDLGSDEHAAAASMHQPNLDLEQEEQYLKFEKE